MEENNLVIVSKKDNFFNLFNKENLKIFLNIIKFIIFDIFVLAIFFISNYNCYYVFETKYIKNYKIFTIN